MSDQPATRASDQRPWLQWDANTAAALLVLTALLFLVSLRLGYGPAVVLTR